MADQQKKIIPINYTNRDFETIRDDLMQIAERFYPNTFQDFSEASFGSLMLDAVAYVGDQLSFYMDYNVNETFLDTAYQYGNIVRQGRILGYKAQGPASLYGMVALYVLVPSSTTGIGVDKNYLPILKRGTQFTSVDGNNYTLTENVDFGESTNVIVTARVDENTGAPTWYAVKAYGRVVSGVFNSQNVDVGTFQRYLRVKVPGRNIAEIISVVDAEGNEYFEVDYLSQDMVYKEITNKNFKNDNVPSILKPYLVSRKFVVERMRNEVYIQFGSGKTGGSDIVADPQSVALDIFGKTYTTDLTFDPSRLSQNESLGIVPSDTTLTIVYRSISATRGNTAVGSINLVRNAVFEFDNQQALTTSAVSDIRNSLEVTNEEPIMGNVSNPSSAEIKRRVFDTFPTQNRAVTQADYENVTYRMPAKFGSVLRCSAQKDPSALKRNINLYVISQDNENKLVVTNSTIKNNLKTWLNHYRMLNDTIDIKDPFIINLGINFSIKVQAGAEKYSVLQEAIDKLKSQYRNSFFIGEPLYISDIYSGLKEVNGVLDVEKVLLSNRVGSDYSSVAFNINDNMSPDGGMLVVPKNAILEIKYPEIDIKGKVK
tara:strand:+ start:10110 stop:11906 length:1797 start_codon:yes stop_codon:yes gene_type:complete